MKSTSNLISPQAVFGYLRCTHEKPEVATASIELQQREIETFCIKNNWPTPVFFCDEEKNGITFERPGFSALIKKAKQSNANLKVVVCTNLERISRASEVFVMLRQLNAFKVLSLDSIKYPSNIFSVIAGESPTTSSVLYDMRLTQSKRNVSLNVKRK